MSAVICTDEFNKNETEKPRRIKTMNLHMHRSDCICDVEDICETHYRRVIGLALAFVGLIFVVLNTATMIAFPLMVIGILILITKSIWTIIISILIVVWINLFIQTMM